MRSDHQQRVDKFMRLAGQDVPVKPVDSLDSETRILRAKLILEEALETVTGLGVTAQVQLKSECMGEYDVKLEANRNFNMIEAVDGCLDVIVVTTGTLSALGVDAEAVQKIVDDNNLAKFGPGGYRRDDGKWIKPPDHKPPTDGIRSELERQATESTIIQEIQQHGPKKSRTTCIICSEPVLEGLTVCCDHANAGFNGQPRNPNKEEFTEMIDKIAKEV